jgi:hypothetical protein
MGRLRAACGEVPHARRGCGRPPSTQPHSAAGQPGRQPAALWGEIAILLYGRTIGRTCPCALLYGWSVTGIASVPARSVRNTWVPVVPGRVPLK